MPFTQYVVNTKVHCQWDPYSCENQLICFEARIGEGDVDDDDDYDDDNGNREAVLLSEKIRNSEPVQNFSAFQVTPRSQPVHKPWHLTSSWAIWNQHIPTMAPRSSRLPTHGLSSSSSSAVPTKIDHKLKWFVIQEHNAVHQQTSRKDAMYL